MTTLMNERTRFFIKISLTLYSRKGDVSCVWEMSWRRVQTVILTQSSSDHSSTSSLSWLGCSTEGHWGPKALSLQADSHAGILTPTDSNRPRHLVILLSHARLLPLFFRLFTQVHLLIDGSVEGQYITQVLKTNTPLRTKTTAHNFW